MTNHPRLGESHLQALLDAPDEPANEPVRAPGGGRT